MPAWVKKGNVRPRWASGSATTPLIALGLAVDVTVMLNRTMPSTTYEVEIVPSASLIGAQSIVVKTRLADRVVLTVRATALLALSSGSITVIAHT